MPYKEKNASNLDSNVLAGVQGKAWHSYGIRATRTVGMESPTNPLVSVWLDLGEAKGKDQCSPSAEAILAEWFPEIEQEELELPDSLYVTFSTLTVDPGLAQEVGHLTIGRQSFRVLPNHSKMRISQEHTKAVIDALRNNEVVGTVGQWTWKEGRIPGE